MDTLEEIISAREVTAVVSVLLNLEGTYAGDNANGKFRFTRVWALNNSQQWQVIAAHSCILLN